MNGLEQIGIAVFGVAAIRLSQDHRPKVARWACVCGLLDSLTKAGVWADDSQIDDLQVVRKTVGGMVRVQVWTQGATA